VYVVKTTPQQDAAVLEYLKRYPNTDLPKDLLSELLLDNCSVRSNGALDAAGIPFPVFVDPAGFGGFTLQPSQPGTSGYRALAAGATVISIPRGSTSIPAELRQFERP